MAWLNSLRRRLPLTLQSVDRRKSSFEKSIEKKRSIPHDSLGPPIRAVFLIPLIPRMHAADWQQVERHLDATLRSLVNQSSSNWHAVVVHHDEPDSDFLGHPQISFVQAPFSPEEDLRNGARDKDRKRFFGGVWARANLSERNFYFTLDADDLIHTDFTSFVNHGAIDGLVISVGWFVNVLTGKVHWKKNFFLSCGSCFGASFSTAELPRNLDDVDSPFYKIMCGPQGQMADRAFALGKSLEALSFPMVAYVINHSESLAIKRSGIPRDWSFGQQVRRNDARVLLDRDFALKDWNYTAVRSSS